MAGLLERPKRVYLCLGVAVVLLFALSSVGHTGSTAQNDASSVGWIGDIGWAGFLLCLLLLIVYSATLLVRAALRRRNAGSRQPYEGVR